MLELAKKVLSLPIAYDSYQSLVGSPRCHQRFISEMLKPGSSDRVLDIGCGVGASVKYLPPSIEYVGIDLSPAYIAKAQQEHGHRGKFYCAGVSDVDAEEIGVFDKVFACGVLHHLSDEIAADVVGLVRRVLKPGGKFVTIDPCYVPGQHWFAKFLIDNDRGEYIRDQEGFRRLVSGLGNVQSSVHHDLLRIPYTQVVMEVSLS